MKFRIAAFALVSWLLSATTAFSMSAQASEDLEALRHVPRDYRVAGAVCEEVARLRLIDKYPASDYEVITGIEYEMDGRTGGELDVVVLQKSDREAVLVAEVKCWENMGSAIRKAREQLGRFQNAMRLQKVERMHLASDRDQLFHSNQFDDGPDSLTISQDGGRNYGFDLTLGLSLEELHEISKELQ